MQQDQQLLVLGGEFGQPVPDGAVAFQAKQVTDPPRPRRDAAGRTSPGSPDPSVPPVGPAPGPEVLHGSSWCGSTPAVLGGPATSPGFRTVRSHTSWLTSVRISPGKAVAEGDGQDQRRAALDQRGPRPWVAAAHCSSTTSARSIPGCSWPASGRSDPDPDLRRPP